MSDNNFKELTVIITELGNKINELQENFENLQKAIEVNKTKFYEIQTKLEDAQNKDNFETLKEIIEQAEMADYGMQRWRTLETKQDLIAAIKKEVLDVV